MLEKEIRNGTYMDTLPSISRLSELLGVCPATVKRILSLLRDRDLVSGEHGRCVRVNPKAAGNPHFHRNVVFLADLSSMATPVFSRILDRLIGLLSSKYICTHVFVSAEQARECDFEPDCLVVINSREMKVIFNELLERYPGCGGIVINMPSSQYSSVMGDGEAAGFEALRHLAEDCGHTHIGILATQLGYPQACFARRCRGARMYAQKNPHIRLSMAEVPELAYCGQESFRLMGELMSKDPEITAVFAVCDMLALGVYGYVAANCLRMPEDIAVIGFDNLDFCTALTPQLTTFSEDIVQSADCLLTLICNILSGKKEIQEYLISPRLIVRGSTVKGKVSVNNQPC